MELLASKLLPPQLNSNETSSACNMSSSSNNKRTERTYYDGDVDFDRLAEHDADFAAVCEVSKDRRWIDFQNPKVVQYVAKCALV